MRSARVNALQSVSWVMTLAILLLLCMGVVFIFSACYISDDQPARTLWLKQILWAGLGLTCYGAMALVDYDVLRKYAWALYAAALFLLVVVLFVGVRANNAQRWLDVFGIHLQPAELAKIAVVMLLARWMSDPDFNPRHPGHLVVVVGIACIPFLLIFLQPDLGTAATLLPVAFVMVVVAGASMRLVGILAGAGVLVGLLALAPLVVPPGESGLSRVTGMLPRLPLSEYQERRIKVFLNLDADPLGAGWNKMQSKIAVGSGGVRGKGLLKGTQNILGFLPRSVAPTDFIYSVIAEEAGFMGSVAVLFLFGMVVGSGTRTALHARDRFGQLLCVGIVTLFYVHVFVNIAMTVGLLPITGLPLPLLSYGGSFTLVTLSALGIIQSVRIRARRRMDF